MVVVVVVVVVVAVAVVVMVVVAVASIDGMSMQQHTHSLVVLQRVGWCGVVSRDIFFCRLQMSALLHAATQSADPELALSRD